MRGSAGTRRLGGSIGLKFSLHHGMLGVTYHRNDYETEAPSE